MKTKKQMVAYCGLVCTNCPTFLATQNDDDAAREITALYYAEWIAAPLFFLSALLSNALNLLPKTYHPHPNNPKNGVSVCP